ncbi:MAG TPA: inositol monophosphatase family protein [Gemmataceae bacterium]|jgi:histidinol-phosphatase|nr:inositol monophosphatase family protein [Gemmataceae bacterium]
MNADWQTRYDLMIRAARDAGRVALNYYPDLKAADFSAQVIWKSDNSPVTIADREAEAHLRRTLLEAFPKDGFLGEESGDRPGTTGYRWIVDPIDGTRSFVRGVPHWATLVGLEHAGRAIAGVAYEPVIDRTWRALHGTGAFRDNQRIHVSRIDRLDESVMFYSSLSWFVKAGRENQFLKLVEITQRQRGFGDYYGHLLVAQGAGEFMVEHGVHVWDVAALKVIVEEAGGRFTDWNGNPTIHTPDCIASNGLTHDAVLAILLGDA